MKTGPLIFAALVAAWVAGRFRSLSNEQRVAVHYLSDVVAGWSLGITIFSLCGVAALVVGQLRQNHGS